MGDSSRRNDNFFGDDPRGDLFDNFFHGRFGDSAGERNRPDGLDTFTFHGSFGDSFDIFQPFRDIMRGFFSEGNQQVFLPFESVEPTLPEESQPANPRDRMLRRPDVFEEPQHHWYDAFTGPQFPPVYHKDEMEDGDLDSRIATDGLDSVLPAQRSFFSSFSSRTVRTADGKVEEKRTVRDSRGKEEITVRRILGDQSHSVTTKKHSDGGEEIVENFVNLDEKMMPDFEKNWNTRPQVEQRQSQIQCPEPSRDSGGFLNVFKRFFGYDKRDV